MPPERPESKHSVNSGIVLGFVSTTWIESGENIRQTQTDKEIFCKMTSLSSSEVSRYESQETVRNYFRLQKPKAMWPVNATHYSEQEEPFTLKDDWWLNGAWGLDGSKLSTLIYWFFKKLLKNLLIINGCTGASIWYLTLKWFFLEGGVIFIVLATPPL